MRKTGMVSFILIIVLTIVLVSSACSGKSGTGVPTADHTAPMSDPSSTNTWLRIVDLGAAAYVNPTYGGEYYVDATVDGGCIITSDTKLCRGGMDTWLVKIDATGTMEWEQFFGECLDLDVGKCVKQTKDGGFIFSGGNAYSALLIKTDHEGDKEWSKSYHQDGFRLQVIDRVSILDDGGYILVINNKKGSQMSAEFVMRLVKLDSRGNVDWERKFGSEDWAVRGHSIDIAADGGYVIVGEVSNPIERTHADFWLLKTDDQGRTEWEKSFGGDGWDVVHSVKKANDGGFVVVGESASYRDDSTWEAFAFVAKIDAEGNVEWEKTFGGCNGGTASTVAFTPDGHFLVAGTIADDCPDNTDASGEIELWMAKLDLVGSMVWQKRFGSAFPAYPNEIVPTSDGAFFMVGNWWSTPGSVMFILKANLMDIETDVDLALKERSFISPECVYSPYYECKYDFDTGGTRGDVRGTVFYANQDKQLYYEVVVTVKSVEIASSSGSVIELKNGVTIEVVPKPNEMLFINDTAYHLDDGRHFVVDVVGQDLIVQQNK